MLPFPSECRERKVKYPAPWGGKGGEASWVQGLPWGIDTFHFVEVVTKFAGKKFSDGAIEIICNHSEWLKTSLETFTGTHH